MTDPLEAYAPVDLTTDPDTISAVIAARSSGKSSLDRHIADICTAVTTGSMDPGAARQVVASLLARQRIIADVVRSIANMRPSDREELADEVQMEVSRKVLDPAASGAFNFTVAVDASACGWARKTAANAAMTKLRSMRRQSQRMGEPTEPSDLAYLPQVGYEIEPDSELALTDLLLYGAAMERFNAARAGTRVASRFRIGVDAVIESSASGLRRCVRPHGHATRSAILDTLEDDPTVAYRSLAAWVSTVYDRGTQADVDPDIATAMLMLWDDQTEDSALTMLDMDPLWAVAFVRAAVDPWPRPALRQIRTMRRLAAETAAGSGGLAWRRLAAALVTSFVAHECEWVSAFATTEDSHSKARQVGHVVARNAFASLCEQAALFDSRPLGATPDQVRESLSRLMTDVLVGHDRELQKA